ncbi:24009_t:CDS:1, partial [Entrophospora sp. SA101]
YKSTPTLKPFDSAQKHSFGKPTSNFVRPITTNIDTGGFPKK